VRKKIEKPNALVATAALHSMREVVVIDGFEIEMLLSHDLDDQQYAAYEGNR
jgi:hypothetical protein